VAGRRWICADCTTWGDRDNIPPPAAPGLPISRLQYPFSSFPYSSFGFSRSVLPRVCFRDFPSPRRAAHTGLTSAACPCGRATKRHSSPPRGGCTPTTAPADRWNGGSQRARCGTILAPGPVYPGSRMSGTWSSSHSWDSRPGEPSRHDKMWPHRGGGGNITKYNQTLPIITQKKKISMYAYPNFLFFFSLYF